MYIYFLQFWHTFYIFLETPKGKLTPMNRYLQISALVTSVLLLLFATSCKNKVQNTSAHTPKVNVRVLKTLERESTVTRKLTGESFASKSVLLTVPYPGTIEKINVKEGESVKKSHLIATINSETVRSSYDMTQATLAQAEDGYRRGEKIHASGGMSEVKWVEIETSLAKAKAAAQASEQALESCRIKAPFEGTVTGIYAEEGTDAAISQPLVRIVDCNSMKISFTVPEADLSSINESDEISVDIPALALSGVRGRIEYKGVEASTLSHTYKCTAKLDTNPEGFFPGMICKITLSTNSRSGIIIPGNAIQSDTQGRYVWVVNGDTVYKRRVTPGGFCADGILIEGGLEEGDKVITDGYRKVSSGMKVNIVK